MNYDRLKVPSNSKISLKDYDPNYTGDVRHKSEAAPLLQAGIEQLGAYQDILYAQNTYSVLIIFQALDAAGKDSTIKHVMSGVNPQGCRVHNFKAPSVEDLDHDYLWRAMKALPERGGIEIFNRSYYEEVLIVRVHPEILAAQQLPEAIKSDPQIWQHRFKQINQFENYLVDNGTVIIKFFLHVSKEEQKKRFLDRINEPEKNWKFSISDVKERVFWSDYIHAYEQVFSHTSTDYAPWYIIPADHKWFTRLAVAEIICDRLRELKLHYPIISEAHRQELLKVKEMLENEE